MLGFAPSEDSATGRAGLPCATNLPLTKFRFEITQIFESSRIERPLEASQTQRLGLGILTESVNVFVLDCHLVILFAFDHESEITKRAEGNA